MLVICSEWYYTRRHNTACGVLADLIRSAHPDARIQREKVLPRDGNGDLIPESTTGSPINEITSPLLRTDLVIVLLGNKRSTIDVSFVNPSCLSYINAGQTHLHDGRAAELRKKEKINKYGFLPKSERFTAFMVEAK